MIFRRRLRGPGCLAHCSPGHADFLAAVWPGRERITSKEVKDHFHAVCVKA